MQYRFFFGKVMFGNFLHSTVAARDTTTQYLASLWKSLPHLESGKKLFPPHNLHCYEPCLSGVPDVHCWCISLFQLNLFTFILYLRVVFFPFLLKWLNLPLWLDLSDSLCPLWDMLWVVGRGSKRTYVGFLYVWFTFPFLCLLCLSFWDSLSINLVVMLS